MLDSHQMKETWARISLLSGIVYVLETDGGSGCSGDETGSDTNDVGGGSSGDEGEGGNGDDFLKHSRYN